MGSILLVCRHQGVVATLPLRALGKETKAEGSEVKTILDYTGARSQPGLYETLQTSEF